MDGGSGSPLVGAQLRAKRAECRANAKAEKVPLFKRPAYVKRCVKS